jgi:hypothetical protein
LEKEKSEKECRRWESDPGLAGFARLIISASSHWTTTAHTRNPHLLIFHINAPINT